MGTPAVKAARFSALSLPPMNSVSMGVSPTAGQRALTRIPCAASSIAKDLVKVTTAPLLAA
jgi:hypothetical protein